MKISKLSAVTLGLASAVPANAASTQATGRIMETQGHEVPSCRKVRLRNSATGADMWFRIPDTGKDDGMLAVTLTALTTSLDVVITYDPELTSGCGTEPKIQYISIVAPG